MNSIKLLVILFSIIIPRISSMQFGFLIKDENNLLNEKFVAFGLIPDQSSSKVKAEIQDSLNAYLHEEWHRRRLEGIERESFLNEPEIISAVVEGQKLLRLKGELAVFLNIFRFSCKRIKPIQSTWKNVVFLNEPTILLSLNEPVSFTDEFQVSLINPAFGEEPDYLYDKFIRWDSDSSSTSEYDEEISFIQSKQERDENENDHCCYTNCVIS